MIRLLVCWSCQTSYYNSGAITHFLQVLHFLCVLWCCKLCIDFCIRTFLQVFFYILGTRPQCCVYEENDCRQTGRQNKVMQSHWIHASYIGLLERLWHHKASWDRRKALLRSNCFIECTNLHINFQNFLATTFPNPLQKEATTRDPLSGYANTTFGFVRTQGTS